MSDIEVLLVDDDATAVQALARMLPPDLHLRFARSAAEAVERLSERVPDLLLLDAHMPGMSGLELLEHLRRSATTAELPVVMVTSYGEPSVQASARRLGALHFIIKPSTPREVQEVIGDALSRPPALHSPPAEDDPPSRLLIVDDDFARIELAVNSRSTAAGWMQLARDHEDALTLAWEASPDLVLINADTRGLNTPALVHALRADPGLAHLPILVYQRSLQPQIEAQYLDLGASDVVGLPCTAAVLRARIRNLVRGKLRVDANLKAIAGRH